MTNLQVPDSLKEMKASSKTFQKELARLKVKAAAGEKVEIQPEQEEFVFEAAPKRTWQGALKGKAKVNGDLFSTGFRWEASE